MMRVLVVDNSTLMRALMTKAITSRSSDQVEVVEAIDGTEALAEIEKQRGLIDLVLCDPSMPIFGGRSLMKILRRP